jgi:hypothetical protein
MDLQEVGCGVRRRLREARNTLERHCDRVRERHVAAAALSGTSEVRIGGVLVTLHAALGRRDADVHADGLAGRSMTRPAHDRLTAAGGALEVVRMRESQISAPRHRLLP